MIQRPDYDHAYRSCGTAVDSGQTECRRCSAYVALAGLNDVTRRLLADCDQVVAKKYFQGHAHSG